MSTANQNPEQVARDHIDEQLRDAGWAVQDKGSIDFNGSHRGRQFENTPLILGRRIMSFSSIKSPSA